jgi:hypothetical protein
MVMQMRLVSVVAATAGLLVLSATALANSELTPGWVDDVRTDGGPPAWVDDVKTDGGPPAWVAGAPADGTDDADAPDDGTDSAGAPDDGTGSADHGNVAARPRGSRT